MAEKKVRITCADNEVWHELFHISYRAGRSFRRSADGLIVPRDWWEEVRTKATQYDKEALDELIGQGRLTIEVETQPGQRRRSTREEAKAARDRAMARRKEGRGE
jgi:hypothetical protein